MTFTRVLLGARVHRRGGVRVLVPLSGEGETLFLEGEEIDLAPGDLLLHLDEFSTVDRALDLAALLLMLWPGGFARVEREIEATRVQDNRLDMEARLLEWAALLRSLLAWWGELDELARQGRMQGVRELAPEVAALLDFGSGLTGPASSPPAAGLERFEELPSMPRPAVVPADEERWSAWKARGCEDILGPGGGLALLRAERFEPRQGQMDMAERIAANLGRHEHLMVEAGTGIGKSLAYLVPALLHGARDDERVVVSTYTKALQAQLIDGDLPLLESFGYPGRVRLLLGRNNYLCTRQLRHAMATRVADREECLAQFALFLWWQQSEEGRREEITEHPWFERYWRVFFESMEPCSPHICHRDPPCFVVRARRLAREADVVVVNHSLLMMDLKSAQSLLGPAKLLVVDEAHELPPVATNALSFWVRRERMEVYRNLTGERSGRASLREVPANLLAVAAKLARSEGMDEACREFDLALDGWLAAFASWYGAVESACELRLGETTARVGRHRYHDGDEAFGPVRGETGRLLVASDAVERSLATLLDRSGDLAELSAEVDEEREAMASLLQFHRDFVAGLRFCIEAADEDWVYWMEWGGSRGLDGIVAAPLTVEEPLSTLWDRHYRSVVMTSATLAVGDDFTPFAESVGFSRVSRYTDSLQIPSPFDFERRALVLTTPELVEPNDPAFPAHVAELLAAIGTAVKTKTLVLCTSYQLIDRVHDELQALLGGEGEDLFAQRAGADRCELLRQTSGGSRERLAASFRGASAAILLATGSFWEGVDFPGRELEVLVVPRLPFAVPTEPLTAGRYDRARRLGRDPFQDVALADAVLRLRQGVGRLLRSSEDRGVVLLLDQRLQARSYGVTFLNSMPRHCEWVASRAEMAERVIEFLRRTESRSVPGSRGE